MNITKLKKSTLFKKILNKAGKMGEKALIASARAFIRPPYLTGKFINEKYQKLSSEAQQRLHKCMIYSAGVMSLTPLAEKEIRQIINDKPDDNIEIKQTNPTNEIVKKNYAATYHITDRESFDKLYKDALPLIQLSMFPTEILVLDAYSDNGKTINTVGLGSWWFPENDDPTSDKWIPVAKYIKKHPNLKVTGEMAMQLTDGWFSHREGGRILSYMYSQLKDCDLKPHEFAAIATCMYNNEKCGQKLCEFVKENYKDPIKCAHKIMSLETKTCKDGILVRHTHEALLYLNVDGYADYIPSLKMKEGVNSKGKKYYTTSVNQLTVKSCKEMRNDLAKGNLTLARQQKNKVCNYVCEGGESLAQIVYKNIDDKDMRFALLGENAQTTFLENMRIDVLFKKALSYQQKKDYSNALDGYQKILASGFDGADIHKNMAKIYLQLGDYDNVIVESRKVLATGEKELYPEASCNIRDAYKAKHCAYIETRKRKPNDYSRS